VRFFADKKEEPIMEFKGCKKSTQPEAGRGQTEFYNSFRREEET